MWEKGIFMDHLSKFLPKIIDINNSYSLMVKLSSTTRYLSVQVGLTVLIICLSVVIILIVIIFISYSLS
jgi:hypothetical protein